MNHEYYDFIPLPGVAVWTYGFCVLEALFKGLKKYDFKVVKKLDPEAKQHCSLDMK